MMQSLIHTYFIISISLEWTLHFSGVEGDFLLICSLIMLENNLQPEIKIKLFASLIHMRFMKIH